VAGGDVSGAKKKFESAAEEEAAKKKEAEEAAARKKAEEEEAARKKAEEEAAARKKAEVRPQAQHAVPCCGRERGRVGVACASVRHRCHAVAAVHAVCCVCDRSGSV